MALDWTHGDLAVGLAKYQAGEFFEAHEFWENVWRVSPQPQKTFLQALIQIAAAHHHLGNHNTRGALSLMRNALGRLQSFPDSFAGIPVASLRLEAIHWIEALESGTSAHPATIEIRPVP